MDANRLGTGIAVMVVIVAAFGLFAASQISSDTSTDGTTQEDIPYIPPVIEYPEIKVLPMSEAELNILIEKLAEAKYLSEDATRALSSLIIYKSDLVNMDKLNGIRKGLGHDSVHDMIDAYVVDVTNNAIGEPDQHQLLSQLEIGAEFGIFGAGHPQMSK